MTLFSLDGCRQPAVGKRPWWRLFEVFENSELHAEFRTRILPYSESKRYLHSAQLGLEILSDLENEKSPLLETLPSEVVRPLFGMTLWNVLATASEDEEWVCKKGPDKEDFGSTEYFRLDIRRHQN